jgi:hypothetical protein
MRPTTVRPAIVARRRRRSATAPVSLGARTDPSGFGERAPRFLTDGFLSCRSPGPSNEMVRAIMGSSQGAPDMKRRIGTAATTAACVLVLAWMAAASAQVFTGRVDVTIEDATGARMPGVNIELDGPVAQTQVADARGQVLEIMNPRIARLGVRFLF